MSPRAKRVALSAIAIAFAVDAAYLLVALGASAAGPWRDVESVLAYPGLTVSDVAFVAGLLAALLAFTLTAARWPRLMAGVWALSGLTALVATVMSAWVLVSARSDGVVATTALDSAGEWLDISGARLLVLALLLLAQCVPALLLLRAAHLAAEGDATWFLRCLLALPLAYGFYHGLFGFAWLFGAPGQDALFYLADAAIALVPAAAYGVAAVLLLTGQRHRAACLLLLAFGVALSLLYVGAWRQYGVWPDLLVASLSLTVTCGALLLHPRGEQRAVAP